mmetsp:Transcript_41465/g.84619  ORF Transcript_41465/g.84619 Transcript_41465/m.84619 type:complete len:238 (+) Transcript_41465:100-813(+)
MELIQHHPVPPHRLQQGRARPQSSRQKAILLMPFVNAFTEHFLSSTHGFSKTKLPLFTKPIVQGLGETFMVIVCAKDAGRNQDNVEGLRQEQIFELQAPEIGVVRNGQNTKRPLTSETLDARLRLSHHDDFHSASLPAFLIKKVLEIVSFISESRSRCSPDSTKLRHEDLPWRKLNFQRFDVVTLLQLLLRCEPEPSIVTTHFLAEPRNRLTMHGEQLGARKTDGRKYQPLLLFCRQ